jgi:hypothetical protein
MRYVVCFDTSFHMTRQVIDETHGAWKSLMSGQTDAGKLWKKA